MAPESSLSELEERILLTLWKLRGIGKNHVREDALRADLVTVGLNSGCTKELASLDDRGFLQSVTVQGEKEISLTPLGLSLLRQIQEDKLEELK
jgi:hypothetical protein